MDNQEHLSLRMKIREATVFLGIIGVAAYIAAGYGISQAESIFGSSATRFENIASYSGTRRVWPPARGWQARFPYTDTDGKVETKVDSNGELEAIIIDNNNDNEIKGDDYVIAALGGRQYRFYADGKVTDKDGKDGVSDKAVTGASKAILEKWNSFLAANFK